MAQSQAKAAIEQAVTTVAQQLESKIDDEINRLDNLNDGDLESIRQQRMAELRKRQGKAKEWAERGHGEYTELQTEQDFFKAMKVRGGGKARGSTATCVLGSTRVLFCCNSQRREKSA